MAKKDEHYLGLPDDLARLALQRMMTCDGRSRAYKRIARRWQSMALIFGVLAAISASLAAVYFVKQIGWLAVGLSIATAIFVPLQNAIGAPARAAKSNDAAGKFELLANDYERYIQLDLGPPHWRREESSDLDQQAHNDIGTLDRHRATINVLDERFSKVSSNASQISFRSSELTATEARAKNLVDYLQMRNVVVPERAVWAH
jgi:hypothetical protein